MSSYFFFASLILVTVALNTIAQPLNWLRSNFLNIYLLGGICTYAVSTVFYIVVLSA